MLYVATNGNDLWSGKLAEANADKTDGPFATLECARGEVRKMRAAGTLSGKGITVMVRAGVYPLKQSFLLDAQDSGAPDAPIVYRAYPGERVCLQGGPTVPPDAFKPTTDSKVLDRLDPIVRGKVLQADLRALGITELGSFPVKYNGFPAAPELFFNDQRMTLARWPNEDWTTIAKIHDPGAIPRTGDKGTNGGVFEYSGDRPARWNVEAGVWLLGYWCFDWSSEAIQIKSIDREERQITLAAPHVYSVKQGNPSPRRYCALNLLEELDQPGEYYIDRAGGLLYFMPPAAMADAHIVISTLNAPVVSLKDAANVVIRGFIVEASLGHGIEVSGGSNNRIHACEIRNTRELGVNVQGGTGHRIEACDIHDTGTGGIALMGGDRTTLIPAGHEAVNNHIWHFSRHKLTYANAFLLQGVGNRAAHNLIHDAPHQAIGVGGNDHIFEYNVVHHICTETDDCGAYYKGRNPSCRGNIVRYNFWHNIGSPMGHGNAAVYFDDGDGGDTVFGNVFFRCGEPGRGSFGTVFSHGGHDNLAENNIFIECKRPLGSAPWNDKRWKQAVGGGMNCFWADKLLKEVDITKPPYTTRYPQLVGFMDPQPAEKRINRAVRNAIVMCADVSSGNWQVNPEENWITDRDPGFVNAAKGDFRLRPDSEVFKRLPGFQPIPFEKMGLYADELRPAPPVEAWTYEPPKPLPPLPKKSASTPRPRSGPVPVFKATKAANPIMIDGVIHPDEWNTADPAKTMILAQDVNGNKAARESRAWLAYDQDALSIAVDSVIHPDTKLDGNEWGANDAIEVAIQVTRKGKAAPISVIRGYGNSFVQFGTTPNGDEEPKTMDPGGIVYKASRPEAGRWTAELRVPFRMLDVDPASDNRVAFNLTVRKTHDDLWLMWEGTRDHSYEVAQAGLLEFAR
ncbi:MAG: right-handed parallel beta-helix repeat-containing protein [Planctomycetota bacterium]